SNRSRSSATRPRCWPIRRWRRCSSSGTARSRRVDFAAIADKKGRPRAAFFFAAESGLHVAELLGEEQDDDRADDRHDETRRMEHGTVRRFLEQTADQAADDRAADAEQHGEDETQMHRARIEEACE